MTTTTHSDSAQNTLRQTHWLRLRHLVLRHAPFVLLAPIVGLTLTTFIHELGHALMVWALGGQVTEFSILLTGSEFGHVSYTLPWPELGFIVAAGPTALFFALGVALLAASGAWRLLTPFSVPFARAGWWYLFVLPAGDVFMHIGGYLTGSSNDILHAFGTRWGIGGPVALLVGASFFALGYVLQRVLLRREDSVRLFEYTALGGVLIAALSVVL